MQPKNPKTDGLKTWLDGLQQESWQLELLISGFSIFLLLGALDPLGEAFDETRVLFADSQRYVYFNIFFGMLRLANVALIICLVVHVALRGVWIAAIGLRYVSGDIDHAALDYRPRFRGFLQRSLGDFDTFIERLERYCSILFSLAFLIFFSFISLTSYLLFIAFLQLFPAWLLGQSRDYVGFQDDNAWELLYLLPGLLYLLDFFTLGFFKRSRWTAPWYYPIYRFMGWITLAWLYRPLYHNLIDERLGRRLARFIPVFVFVLMMLASIRVITSAYFPYYFQDGRAMITYLSYDDQLTEESDPGWRSALDTRYPTKGYVELFVPYIGRRVDPIIEREFPTLAVGRYTGFGLGDPFNFGQLYNRKSNNDSLLLALSSTVEVYLNDSLRQDVAPRFHHHPKRDRPGLLYVLPTHDLPRGEHFVRIRYQQIEADTLAWEDWPGIYFYR